MEFLFGLDQSNVCRDIQKIERLIRQCLPIPQKLYKVTRRLKTREEVEEYFPGFMFYRLYMNNQFQDLRIGRKENCTIQERKRNTQSRICIQLTKKD